MKRSPIRRRGKKTAAWEKARAKLKIAFERAGITYCEECGGRNMLTFAHPTKRRFITTEEGLLETALLCIRCHGIIERQSHEIMASVVRRIIANRSTPVIL